jgi:hypothetical protein
MIRQLASKVAFKSRQLLDPVRHRRWRARYLFPVRNVFSLRRPFRLSAGGESFLVYPAGAADLWAARRIVENQVAVILDLLQPNMTFFDIGADVGAFSIPAARKLKDGIIFSFESSPPSYNLLCENLRLNAPLRASTFQLAFGDSISEGPAKKTTLDAFVLESRIPAVDVLRLDARGAELAVLHGANGLLLRADSPLFVYSSFLSSSKSFGYHPVESMWLLQKHGYSFFIIDSTSGKISIPVNSRAYDAMVIAVKPAHPAYAVVKELAR